MKDSIKYSIITMIFLFGYKNSFGQKMNKNYMLFSKSDEYTEYLEFKNDSIVTRKPYLIKCGVRITESKNEESNIYRDYQYEKHENKITIYNFDKSNDLILRNSDTDYFINEHFGFLYVLRNLFDEFPDLAMKLEKEIFWLDSPKTSCGIVRKKGKKNRKFSRIIKKKDIENLNFDFYRGYEAFEKFGYEFVFGITEITNKKNGS